jgi:two-component system CheB/CheR fusion protein
MPEKSEKRTRNNKVALTKKTSAGTKVSKRKSFPIVSIGGSAGAFPAFENFFTHMPSDSGMAFVVVMHLDPNHKGQIADILAGYTAMAVHEALDGIQIEPDHVYVIPPNKDMGIHNRKLLLLNIAKPNGFRQPIDYFFQSLAEDQWNRAVGIVLSGMGSDGETGVRLIKEKLGMVMVQDPETAMYDSMPLASIGTNLADYVLAPEEMPVKLIQYLNHPVLTEEPTEQARSEIRNANSVQKILMLLRSHTGHDFSLYKKSTILRRIDRRVAFHQQPDYVHYVNFLRETPHEINILFNELLIGVTKFFRDAYAFESLKVKLSHLIGQKKATEPIRVWIAGCSTGEEAYSVAMVLMECLDSQALEQQPKIQIFATDLDAEAIEHARNGNYRSNIAADISEERISRFFVQTEAGYTVKKNLRETIVFAQHNLIKDAPFTRLDLLCCRNVMIYLTTELQRKIIPIFHYSLNQKAIMFLGPAETIGGFTELFIPIDPKWKIFERREDSSAMNKMIDFPFHVARQPIPVAHAGETEKTSSKVSVANAFNRLLIEHFSPSSVLVNEKGDILYTNGKAGSYLQLPFGEAVMNIYKMAREELRYVIGNIIHQARSQMALVSISDIKLKDGDQVRLVNLHASFLTEAGLQGLVMLVFEDKGMQKKAGKKLLKDDASPNQAVEDLERELVYTKQQLHSTIGQMETSLEELKSTNEELQSTNEELQSTNEESLTTKEEMQSLNEELMTVNVQYQAKAEELSRLNNDMKNLLDSTEIGTIFLDNNANILRYTPQVKKLFSIIPTDLGRSLSDIVSNFDFELIAEPIKEVIDRLAIQEIEVKTKSGEWYKVRIMPYRTLDNFISGAVLTFSLVTTYKQMQFQLQALQEYSASIIDIIQQPAVQLDQDFTICNVNEAFIETFDVKKLQLIGDSFERFMQQQWNVDDPGKLLSQIKGHQENISAEFTSGSHRYGLSVKAFFNMELNGMLLILVVIRPL